MAGYIGSKMSVANSIADNKIDYLENFGAVGNGSTDDTSAIQSALDNGGAVIDGNGKIYKVTATLDLLSDTIFQNATLTFATNSDILLAATGTQGSALSLTSNSNYPTRTINLSSENAATLAKGDMVFITDSQDFCTGVDRSEINFVSAVSGTTVTLASEVFTDYTTANSATISKVTPKENITLRDVRLIGADDATTPANQTGLEFSKCLNVNLENCRLEGFDTRLSRFSRCAHVHVSGCYFSNSDRSGFGYGITVSDGTHFTTVTNSTFERMRHGVATGGDDGVIRFVNVLGCTFNGMKDAMLDTHTETDFVNYSNNISTHVEDNSTDDGILISGGHALVSNNIIDRPVRHGILIQSSVLTGAVDNDISYVVTNNLIKDTGTASGITINSSAAANRPIRGVTVTGNTITGSSDNGVNIKAAGADIRDVCVSSNTIAQASGNAAIHIRSEDESSTAASIRTVTITGNTCSLTNDAPDACIELSESGSSSIESVAITGNSMLNGTHGVNAGTASKVVIVGNMIDSPGTADISSGSASNVTSANNG